jgi:hypothetical protein
MCSLAPPLWDFTASSEPPKWAIAPKHYPRGVFKFRTIEEAQKAREKHLPLK